MQDLAWLGLDWDEGPGADNPAHATGQPEQEAEDYYQSRRTPFYEQCLAKLDAQNLIYPCFCSRAELHAASAPHLGDGSYVYGGRCQSLSPEDAAKRQSQRPGAVRVRVPQETVAFTDLCQGPYQEELASQCGDFILRRSDGVFAYQLAAPADDGAMGVTQVVRGRDLLPSTARQIWLMQTLGYTPPVYAHHPVLLAPDGRRLAKRDKDLDLAVLRARLGGPEKLVGALAHAAGLVPRREPLRAADLVRDFNWALVPREDITVGEDFWGKL